MFPPRAMTWKCSWSPSISIRMKLRSWSNPAAVSGPAADVAFAQLAGRAGGEIVDPALRIHPFVEVLVPREHDVHAVLHEQRLDQLPQIELRSVALA